MIADVNLTVESVMQNKNRIMISVNMGIKNPINHCVCEEDYDWNLSICACECDKDCKIGEYLKG